MNKQIQSIAKDNIATGTVLAAMFIAIIGNFIEGSEALTAETAQAPVQHIEAIVVSASRDEIISLDAIVVTAARDTAASIKTR